MSTTDPAPAPPGDTTDPTIEGVSHLSLSVRDLDRSLAFYRDVLGLPVLREPYDGEVFAGRQAMLLAGRVMLSLQQHDAVAPTPFVPTQVGLDHLAFHVRDLDALEAWHERLEAAGIAPSPIREIPPFGWLVEFRDPDAIQMELFAIRASSPT